MKHPSNNANDKFIGMRLLIDMCNERGEVLIPSFTILNKEHDQLLKEHQIVLSDKQVMDAGPYGNMTASENESMVDDMVVHIKRIFQEIRRTKKIPLVDIRKTIVPVIHHAVKQPLLFDLFAALHSKDDYMYRHSFAVGVISTLIGKWLHLKDNELLQLTTAAILHDVGKTQIPEEILSKPDILITEEQEIMKRHVTYGYELMKNTVGTNHKQSLVALQHHERMDGQGYPLGIPGLQIDLFSKIVAVADVFHAMASKRVYSHSLPFFEVLSQMEKDSFGKLDTSIVHLLIEKIMQNAIGYNVLLSNGSKGKVIHINPQNQTKPLVQVGDQFFDLSLNSSIKIEQILVNK